MNEDILRKVREFKHTFLTAVFELRGFISSFEDTPDLQGHQTKPIEPYLD